MVKLMLWHQEIIEHSLLSYVIETFNKARCIQNKWTHEVDGTSFIA